MVVAENMSKASLKISVSDTESSIEETDEELESGEDVEADSESDGSDDKKEASVLMTNEGWGDSVAKILGSKKPKNKKTLVLSRAKKHSEIVKAEKDEKPSFEVIGEGTEKSPDIKKEGTSDEPPPKRIKHEKASIRQKPNILEKDRERLLTKIATKGVVQLFNAVRNQQKTLEKELDENVSEVKKERIMKKFDKRTFLDTLMGKSKSINVDEAKTSKLKDEVKDEDKPRWNALRDDFMMGAKMKDWDKEAAEE